MTTEQQAAENEKKLTQLRTKLEFYTKLDKKIDDVLQGRLEIEDWANKVFYKKRAIEKELDDLKLEMDLPDEKWDEDEGFRK